MDKWLKLENKIGKKLSSYIGDGYGNYLYDFNNFNSPFNKDFDNLYFQSANDDYYWLYCRMEVYRKTFTDRFEQFKNRFTDGEISDFAEQEIKRYEKRKFLNGYADTFGIKAGDSYYSEYTYFGHNLKRICKKEIFDKIELTQNKKIKFLMDLKEKNKFEDNEIEKNDYENIHNDNLQNVYPPVALNPHQQIFPNEKCWQLFEYWKDNAKVIKADLCFVYWKMIEDKLMYKITPTQFAEWLFEGLNFDLEGYWKQIHRVDKADRKRLYSMAKNQFNLKESQY